MPEYRSAYVPVGAVGTLDDENAPTHCDSVPEHFRHAVYRKGNSREPVLYCKDPVMADMLCDVLNKKI